MKDINEVITIIQERLDELRIDMTESRKLAGINSPGFNQDFGAYGVLCELLEEINV